MCIVISRQNWVEIQLGRMRTRRPVEPRSFVGMWKIRTRKVSLKKKEACLWYNFRALFLSRGRLVGVVYNCNYMVVQQYPV